MKFITLSLSLSLSLSAAFYEYVAGTNAHLSQRNLA